MTRPTTWAARMLGWSLALTLAGGCEPQPPECADGQQLVDNVCVDEDTDPVFDTDIGGLEVEQTSLVTLEYTVSRTPNESLVEFLCDGRVVFDDEDLSSKKTFTQKLQLDPGDDCEVILSDERGGTLPSGSLTYCSTLVASWDEQRAQSVVVASGVVPECVRGCTDPIAENYVDGANLDDGTCQYIVGCTDPDALNYSPEATRDNGSCNFGGFGSLMIEIYTDANPSETRANVTCAGFPAISVAAGLPVNGTATREALIDGGFECVFTIEDTVGDRGAGGAVFACGQEIARRAFTTNPVPPRPPITNYVPYTATIAEFKMPVCSGCTNPAAEEYDPDAQIDDGSCTTPEF